MKSTLIMFFTLLLMLNSNNSTEQINHKSITFGIYEVANLSEFRTKSTDSPEVLLENKIDPCLPIVGLIETNHNNINLESKLNILKTHYSIDKVGKYSALVALKDQPSIQNSDIEETTYVESKVEIYFTNNSAKKWAAITKKNINKYLAFV